MAGDLQLAQTARAANARLRAARDLEARWKVLPPEDQAEAREEWENVKAALVAVRARFEAGPRGFVREFKAGLEGTDAEAVAPPRPLHELAAELHVATNALRDKLNAVE
jgi:cytochrome c1